jgi:hypothetical protein
LRLAVKKALFNRNVRYEGAKDAMNEGINYRGCIKSHFFMFTRIFTDILNID